jgi:hypothetical protein
MVIKKEEIIVEVGLQDKLTKGLKRVRENIPGFNT